MEWFPLLGLANRARKVVSGEDLVIKEIRNARAKLVLLTEDASANTAKKYPINAIIIKCLIKSRKPRGSRPLYRQGITCRCRRH